MRIDLKRYEGVVSDYEAAIRLDPSDSHHRNLALFLSTCPDAKYRDGKRAVEHARTAIEKAGEKADRNHLLTLAAAHAEAGDFDAAVQEQQKALKDGGMSDDQRSHAEKQLERFRAKKQYHDNP
jgi:tetratricopeptide (TPR) repeat protein